MNDGPLVTVKCLRHIYPDQTTVDLCNLDFRVEPGQRVVILGANGSGKTTLLFHILGLLKPLEGHVHVLGRDPGKDFRAVRHEIGVVLQNVDEQVIGPTVWDDVLFGPMNAGVRSPELEERGERILERLGIAHLRHKVPQYLSGGERRKVALAGALVNSPRLLVLDEPFSGLDPASRDELVDLLSELNRQDGLAYVMALHEMELLPQIADYVYVLTRGGIALEGSPHEVLQRTDELRRQHLDVPQLVELFNRLAENNWPVEVPLSVQDAFAQLQRTLARSG